MGRGDRSDATKVEVTFARVEDGTAVTIEHRGWERLGAVAEERRERNRRGWGGVLPRYRIAALVDSYELVIEDWTGEVGPVAPLHVHHEDDEAWLVLEGALLIRVGDDDVRAGSDEAVFPRERRTLTRWWSPLDTSSPCRRASAS